MLDTDTSRAATTTAMPTAPVTAKRPTAPTTPTTPTTELADGSTAALIARATKQLSTLIREAP